MQLQLQLCGCRTSLGSFGGFMCCSSTKVMIDWRARLAPARANVVLLASLPSSASAGVIPFSSFIASDHIARCFDEFEPIGIRLMISTPHAIATEAE